jgi:hypothetical protein
MLQSRPMRARGRMWVKAQTRVPSPIVWDSTNASSCLKYDMSEAWFAKYRYTSQHPLPYGRGSEKNARKLVLPAPLGSIAAAKAPPEKAAAGKIACPT